MNARADWPADRPGDSAALRRVLRQSGAAGLLHAVADGLAGADLTTLLLEAFRRRADRLRPADVLRQYRADRFVAPGSVDHGALRRAEDAMLAALPGDFDVLALSPVVPLGTHSAVATVDPRNVIATIRGTEVAADPTNALALEAAVRRRRLTDAAHRSTAPVKLAALQRVTRAALFDGPVSFAHFELLALVTAGRDTGNRAFEREQLAEHLGCAAAGLRALGAGRCRMAITWTDERFEAVFGAVAQRLGGTDGVEVVAAPERESGRGYYRGLCFKVYAASAAAPGELLEVGDGGFVDWTAKYLESRKERLLISGYGLERIALTGQA